MYDRRHPENLEARIGYLEENRRYIQEALEMALSLGDFQEEVNLRLSPVQIFLETEKRIRRLLSLEARAFYFFDPDSSDLNLSVCRPKNRATRVESEMEFMIDEGFLSWAIRERRGVSILTRDRKQYMLLHVIATHSRIRGLFVGLFPSRKVETPDISLDLLSIILRSAANAIESAEFHTLLEDRNRMLEEQVRQKTEEVVRFERHLRRAQKMEAIGTLAGEVAHDLNNILAGIVSYPDLILMQIPQDSPLRKPVGTIKNTGKKAADIVQDMLTLARGNAVVAKVVNLNDIVAEYLNSPEFEKLKIYHPGVRIHADLASDLSNMMGSAIQLMKTVMNLVSNAAEAMQSGGKLQITAENYTVTTPINGYEKIEAGDYVRLTVSDTGIGISPDDMERIFEPFYSKKVMGRSGTGLGMAVVWGTVKDHEGYFDITSEEGRGTAIQIYFPSTRQQVPEVASDLSSDKYMGKGESILVVDDVKEQRNVAEMILKELNYAVSTASRGESAVRFLKDNPVDLVVLDMLMDPGMDGLDAYQEMLKHQPGQRAIIASGSAETERVKKAQALGAGHYLRKPYTIEKLGTAVRGELDRSPRVEITR